jgi:hypothetical protein
VMSKRYFKYQKSKGLWNLIMNFPMDSNVDVNRPTYPN